MRSFTEATAVRDLVTVPPYAFAATNTGLDRWDLRSGRRTHLGPEHGLPDEHIVALHYDGEALLWVVTDTGVARYDTDAATFQRVPPPPTDMGPVNLEGASLASDSSGGVWLGLSSGLFQLSRAGTWTRTEIDAPVTSLFHSPGGDLWIGTERGLFTISRRLERELGREQLCDIASVRFIVEGPDGGPVIVGENAQGAQRVAFHVGDGCHTYRVAPDEPWLSAARRGDELVVLTPNHLYALHTPPKQTVHRRLRRSGARLFRVLPVVRGAPKRAPYLVRALNQQVPNGAQTIAAIGDEVLVGTRNLGTARVLAAGRGNTRWLRRFELVDDATTLSVACAGPNDCYVATGGNRVWRFDGTQFIDNSDGRRRVLAVAEDARGDLIALRKASGDERIRIARLDQGVFTDVPDLALEIPGRKPSLTFARFSPAGVLWVGLQYIDEQGHAHPFGIAQVDIDVGRVTYHRDSADVTGEQGRVLPVPTDVVDAAFAGDEIWLATAKGAVRVAGTRVQLFDERRGLRAEALRGVAVTRGRIHVASDTGVAVFDESTNRWDYLRALRGGINDLEASEDGRLWMATSRGLAVFDGERVRRLDARRGLIEDDIQDVAIDRFGRIWIRGAQGIGLVTP